MHPLASEVTCRGGIARAHTIQRGGGLSRISKEGHVGKLQVKRYSGAIRGDSVERTLVGLRSASTFTGFCGLHDTQTFAPLETRPFSCSQQQVFLLAYRALCRELYYLRVHAELAPVYREGDRGSPLDEQVMLQLYMTRKESETERLTGRLGTLRSKCDNMLLGRDFSEVRFYAVMLAECPDIMCNGIHEPIVDFEGNYLSSIGRQGAPTRWMHLSLIATDEGGAAVFSWWAGDTTEEIINTLDALSDDELPHAIVRYAFEFFGNVYFSPLWWDGLTPSTQERLAARSVSGMPPFYESARAHNCLVDDGMRAVRWEVSGRQWIRD